MSPPRATRHRAVLELPIDIALFVNNIHSPTLGVAGLLLHALDKPSGFVCGVSALRLDDKYGCNLFASIEISFWTSHSNIPLEKVCVRVPARWSPRLYLGALYNSLLDTDNRILSVFNSYVLAGVVLPHNTINNVHHLYYCDLDEIEQMLTAKFAISRMVVGGSNSN